MDIDTSTFGATSKGVKNSPCAHVSLIEVGGVFFAVRFEILTYDQNQEPRADLYFQ